MIPEKKRFYRYGDDYIFFTVSVPYSAPIFTFKINVIGKNIQITDVLSYGVKVGYCVKFLKEFELLNGNQFITARNSEEDENLSKLLNNEDLFAYESENGFYIGIKNEKQQKRGFFN